MKVLYDFIRHLLTIIGFRESTHNITKLDIDEILQTYNKNVSYSYSHEFESPKDPILYSKIIDNLSDLITDNDSPLHADDHIDEGSESSERSRSSADDKNDMVSVSDLTTNFDYNMLSTINTSDEISESPDDSD